MSNDGSRQLRLDPDSHEIRVAAEAIVNASWNVQHNSNSVTHSIIHSPYNMSNAFIAGNRHDRRMSNVRRFFCWFVTFDLFLTLFVWLVCIVVSKI